MKLAGCPFCKSDVLTIYGNEKMHCNGCGMTFERPVDSTESILDIWLRLRDNSESQCGYTPAQLLHNSTIQPPVQVSQNEEITNNEADNDEVEYEFGDVDEI